MMDWVFVKESGSFKPLKEVDGLEDVEFFIDPSSCLYCETRALYRWTMKPIHNPEGSFGFTEARLLCAECHNVQIIDNEHCPYGRLTSIERAFVEGLESKAEAVRDLLDSLPRGWRFKTRF